MKNGIILNEDVFTDDSINIFTDASIKMITGGKVVACAGAVAILGNFRGKRANYQFIKDTTNNNAELKAIRLGVNQAIAFKDQYRIVRIFSDSQISVFGIRDRIFKWNTDSDGYYKTSEGSLVKNQDVMLEIVKDILDNELRLEIYHQNGHVNTDNIEELNSAIHTFCISNSVRGHISYEFIKAISDINNYVDRTTRTRLLEAVDSGRIHGRKEPLRFTYNPRDIDITKYSKLVLNTV